MKKLDLKIFEVKGDVIRHKWWRESNPDFMGPPSLCDVYRGWFHYTCIAVNEDDAIEGAIKRFTEHVPTERSAFDIKKPRLIEWVSFHTDKAKENV